MIPREWGWTQRCLLLDTGTLPFPYEFRVLRANIMKGLGWQNWVNGLFEDDLTTFVLRQPRVWANNYLAPWMAVQLQTSRLVNLIGSSDLHELSTPATWPTLISRRDSFFFFSSSFFSLRHGLRDLGPRYP